MRRSCSSRKPATRCATEPFCAALKQAASGRFFFLDDLGMLAYISPSPVREGCFRRRLEAGWDAALSSPSHGDLRVLRLPVHGAIRARRPALAAASPVLQRCRAARKCLRRKGQQCLLSAEARGQGSKRRARGASEPPSGGPALPVPFIARCHRRAEPNASRAPLDCRGRADRHSSGREVARRMMHVRTSSSGEAQRRPEDLRMEECLFRYEMVGSSPTVTTKRLAGMTLAHSPIPKRVAFPPTAAVLIVVVCSVAKRTR